jgi:AraC-like DNA-binding protein
MSQVTDWNFIFVFVSGVIGFLVGLILFFENKNASYSAKLLAGFLFSISIVSINLGLMNTNFYLNFPYLWRVCGWIPFTTPAFSFLYIRSIIYPSKKIDYRLILLFLPAILNFFILIPLYCTETSEKIAIIRRVLVDKALITLEPDVILPLGWGTKSRVYYGLAITFAQFILLFNWKRKATTQEFDNNKSTYKWALLFSTVSSFFCALLVIEFFLHLSRFVDLTHQILISFSGMILFVSLNLLFRPSLLFGINPNLKNEQSLVDVKREKKESHLTLEQKSKLKETIVSHFNQNAPYIKNGYSINDLSAEIKIPVYLLSSFINDEYQMNFNEWINNHRIEYLKNLLKTSPKHLNLTLESLGNQVGFSSRSAFNIAIKKRTGKTPSEFFAIKHQVMKPN